MSIGYVIVECDCQREQLAVSDEEGEDIRLFAARKEIVEALEKCEVCGRVPSVYISMEEMHKDEESVIPDKST